MLLFGVNFSVWCQCWSMCEQSLGLVTLVFGVNVVVRCLVFGYLMFALVLVLVFMFDVCVRVGVWS